ncbi:putative transcription factor interactor and regulator CCHC(Zn) family [Helianthus debilis subsp. tardiflorus]
MAAHIAEEMAAIIPNLVVQVQQALNNPDGANTSRCSFKHFRSCDPLTYDGTTGATILFRWYEEMESTFLNCECPDIRKVRYATGCLLGNALSWWNAEKNTRGAEAAVTLSWDQLKEIMTEKFCPRHEIKKLEDEFWTLEQDSGNNVAYNKRFHEQNKICPYLFTPLSRLIEQYIGGLPDVIKDTVDGSKPETLEAAMRLAGQLTENRIKPKHLDREGSKGSAGKAPVEESKEAKETNAESSSHPGTNKKHKGNGRNYAVTTNPPIPATPPNQVAPIGRLSKKPYTGPHPVCNRCNFHHQVHTPCQQCTNCGRFGHLAHVCRSAPRQAPNQHEAHPNNQLVTQPLYQLPQIMAPPPQNMIQPYYQPNPPMMPPARACFNCGDSTHFRNTCPRLVNIINAQAQANPVNQANHAAEGRGVNNNANQAGANNAAGNV